MNAANKTIKVMLVDDHPLLRMGIKKVIEMEEDMNVVCEAGCANEAINNINKFMPDIVVVDISLDGEVNGIDLVKAIKSRFSSIKTLILSMFDENIYAERTIRAGARGYVTKKDAPEKIVDALRIIMDGEIYLSDRMSRNLIDKFFHGATDAVGTLVENLTDRELEIYQLIGNGFGTGEIARKLNLSTSTVESHKSNIKEKLNLTSGTELTKSAIQWALNQK